MGKKIRWVREEKLGRLIYRRRYPADVQKVLSKLEKKVPLGARWQLTPEGSAAYHRACADFDRDVLQARAAARIAAKKAAAAFDKLSSQDLTYLGDQLIYDRRTGLDQRLRQGHGRILAELIDRLLPELRNARLDANAAALEAVLGPTADDLLASEGLRLDPADRQGREALIWELSGRLVREGPTFSEHAQGFSPPIPPKPARPANARGRTKTVSALIDAYKAAKWDGWGLSSRAAVKAPFRALLDAVGERPVTEMDRAAAREIFELVKALPAGLGKHKDLKDLPIPEAVERGRALGLPTISPKTVNASYMGHIAAAFAWAEAEQWIRSNPFKKLAAADPVAEQDKRDAFTVPQLNQLFTSGPWATPQAPGAARPGRYWLPLIALFTGMRLAEIGGLRVMDAAQMDGVLAMRVRPHAKRSIKNSESRRDVPVPRVRTR